MASYIFLLITLIILLTIISLSNGGNVDYAACSDLSYSCGSIQNIKYPFWGGDRPESCGISKLKLDCDGYNHTMIWRANVSGLSLKLNLTSINTSSHTMVVSNDDWLFQKCPINHTNNFFNSTTLFTILKPRVEYKNISMHYNCSDNFLSCFSNNNNNNQPPKPFNCSNFGGKNGIAYYYFVNSSSSVDDDIRSENQSCLSLCHNNVIVPVATRDINKFKVTQSLLPRGSYKWHFQIKYNANFTACSKCEDSGGKCGSSGPNSDRFVCHCPDRSYPLHCSQSDKIRLEIYIGTGVVSFVLVIIICIAIWYLKKKSDHSKFRTRSYSIDSSASELERGSKVFGVPLFSYTQLVEATSNFDQSNELGSGGFGTVYYGKLKEDGREVAVKRLYEKNYTRLEQFMNEIQILTRLKHDNLVVLHGCTSRYSRELLLVYEYVNNGTVADHLYGENTKSEFLPWPVRLRIAIETATALSYLHASDIVHRDVKTNNILLDSNFSVKVADFGLSRLFPTDKTHVSTAPQGTPGYLDPEYHQCYQLTNKSDVYSFGVVLIELVSSLPAIDMDRHRLEINLSNYAMNRIQRCAFHELIDPQLGFATDFKVRRMSILVAELAFQCLQHDKEFRPSMEEVLDVLNKIESVDYEALQEDERVKGIPEDVVLKMRIIDNSTTPLPSPREDDHAKLLNNNRLIQSSPMSMIDRWISGSTISNTSK